MSRASIALCVALMLAVASGAVVTNSLTTSAFSAAPGKVFDGTATTGADETTWGTCTNAVFGAGETNETVHAYCYAVTSGSITKVYSRTLNASLLSNGTASTDLSAKKGDDAAYTTAITILGTNVATATGLGNMAIAYTANDGTGCAQVYVAIFTGGSATPTTKAITTGTCSHCSDATAGSTGVGFVHTVHNVFYENKTYYVTYSTAKYTETAPASSSACTTGTTFPVGVNAQTNAQLFAYVQGTDGSTLKWETVPTIYTGTATAVNTALTVTAAALSPNCGPGNSTLSVTFLCTYYTGATPNVLNYIPVTVETGAAGTAVGIATNDAALASGTAGTVNSYTFAGVVHSNYQHGILINKKAETYDTSNVVTGTANTLTFYNLTADNKTTQSLGITNSVDVGAFSGEGLPFSEGWGLIDVSSSAASTYAASYSAWYANGTMNGSRTGFFSGNSAAMSGFIDANGAFWIGTYSLADVSPATLTTGNLGKLVAQVYAGANVLSTILSVVALFIVSIFAF